MATPHAQWWMERLVRPPPRHTTWEAVHAGVPHLMAGAEEAEADVAEVVGEESPAGAVPSACTFCISAASE